MTFGDPDLQSIKLKNPWFSEQLYLDLDWSLRLHVVINASDFVVFGDLSFY